MQFTMLLLLLVLIGVAYSSASYPNNRPRRDPVLSGTDDLPPFAEALAALNLDYYEQLQTANERLPRTEMATFTQSYVPYIDATSRQKGKAPLIAPPAVTIRCDAHKFAHILTGKPAAQPNRIIDFIPFSHELDLLEIRMFELNDTVDAFVVLEGSHTHRGNRKPLFLARHIERYEPFKHKLIHVIADDSEHIPLANLSNPHAVDWAIENQMRTALYRKYIQASGKLGPYDLLLHGDLDEIPNRDVMLHLRNCALRSPLPPLFFTGAFLRWNVQHMPPEAHNQFLNYPNLFRESHMKRVGGEPSLYRGVGKQIAADSAVHLNRFSGSLVDYLYKEATMAESGIIDFALHREGMAALITRLSQVTPHWAKPAPPDKRRFLPWYLVCNPHRYPYMWWSTQEAEAVLAQIRQGKNPRDIELPSNVSLAYQFQCASRLTAKIEEEQEVDTPLGDGKYNTSAVLLTTAPTPAACRCNDSIQVSGDIGKPVSSADIYDTPSPAKIIQVNLAKIDELVASKVYGSYWPNTCSTTVSMTELFLLGALMLTLGLNLMLYRHLFRRRTRTLQV
jgi:hypothetical protein